MARIVQLKAVKRDRAGKGAARAVRREGLVPGVVYGDKQEPQLVSLGYVDMLQQVQTGRFLSTLVDLEVDGTTVRTIPRDVQFDPVRDFIIHADFLRLGAGARITVEVIVQFRNHEESPGIKRGGVLNVVRHEVELNCPADSIPEEIVVDLTGLDIGDSVHISSISLPEGAVPTITDRDFTIATIASPAGLKEELKEAEEAAEAAEAAEGEEEGEEAPEGKGAGAGDVPATRQKDQD
jgi:large subunit ribosomal protein L25